MTRDAETDTVLIADVLARMARGERFRGELERRVMLAASKMVSAGGSRKSSRTPVGVRVLWIIGLLAVGALGGQAARVVLEALRGAIL